MGENIGAAARAMKNFGLRDMRLVAPRDGWPNAKAVEMAAHAADVIEQAKLFATTQDAVADLQCVYATTARERYMEKPMTSPRTLFADAAQAAMRCGILFGPERSGLSNEDVALADAILSIPVHPDYASLNLAQAVGLVAYEWFQQGAELHMATVARSELASKGELQSLFDHLEGELDARGFWKAEGKKPIMWRNIRNMLQRVPFSAQELRTFRGIIRCLTDYERR